MIKIFILHQTSRPEDLSLIDKFKDDFTQRGHQIISPNLIPKDALATSDLFKQALLKCDVFIILVSHDSFAGQFFYNQFIQIENFVKNSENKILFRILMPPADMEIVPDALVDRDFYGLGGYEPFRIDRLVNDINVDINALIGKNLAKEEKAAVIQDKIESSAASYIDTTILDLSKRESTLNSVGLFWYIIGFVSLALSIVVAAFFTKEGLASFENIVNWSKVLYFSLKSVFIIALLIATSKYAFNLGKFFMNEALRLADRKHAISFGKFYLDVFDKGIEREEFKDIFRDWNMNGSHITNEEVSDSYDPKLLEKLIESVKEPLQTIASKIGNK